MFFLYIYSRIRELTWKVLAKNHLIKIKLTSIMWFAFRFRLASCLAKKLFCCDRVNAAFCTPSMSKVHLLRSFWNSAYNVPLYMTRDRLKSSLILKKSHLLNEVFWVLTQQLWFIGATVYISSGFKAKSDHSTNIRHYHVNCSSKGNWMHILRQ